jgi:hypothetical protein
LHRESGGGRRKGQWRNCNWFQEISCGDPHSLQGTRGSGPDDPRLVASAQSIGRSSKEKTNWLLKEISNPRFVIYFTKLGAL